MTRWLELGDEDDRALEAFMTRVRDLPVPGGAGEPMRVWWKAQLVRRWDAERRAQAPLEAMERVEIIAGLAAAGVLLFWVVPMVGRIVAGPLLSLLG